MPQISRGTLIRQRWSWTVWGLLAALFLSAPTAGGAQVSDDYPGRRPIATRAELEAALAEAERVANSDGFSSGYRESKRTEASLIRERLTEGDFQVGDQVNITMQGGDTLSTGGQIAVGPGRVLTLPGLPDIPLRGVLRSEIQQYLEREVARYIRNPQIKARALIRLSVLGGVGRPGFYQLEAEMLLSDALTAAGGISNTTELAKSEIKRNEERIVDGEMFQTAINDGRSLDQLNLRAGDVIDVGQRRQRSVLQTIQTVAIIPGLILSIYGIGRLVGAF